MARNPDGRLVRFSDYAFSCLRDILSARESLLAFCHPSVTAGRLQVHRSTLDYRIKRAEQIMGVDLRRANDRFDVWLSLRFLAE